MPSVAELDLPVSPRDDPLSYPGLTLNANYLWLDAWVYDIAPVLGAGPGQWRIRVDGGPLALHRGTTERSLPERLADALAVVGAAGLPERSPVMAFGSNGAPAQLLDKFAGLAGSRRVVPVMRGVVRGLAISHSPHVSPPGYLPYVLVRCDPAAELPVFLLWLDAEQLRVLTRTEPNYRLEIVDNYPVVVETGDTVTRYHAYRGRWGALRWAGSPTPIGPHPQASLLELLCAADWFAALVGPGDPRTVVRRLAGDSALRDRVRREFADRGLAVGDGLGSGGGLRAVGGED